MSQEFVDLRISLGVKLRFYLSRNPNSVRVFLIVGPQVLVERLGLSVQEIRQFIKVLSVLRGSQRIKSGDKVIFVHLRTIRFESEDQARQFISLLASTIKKRQADQQDQSQTDQVEDIVDKVIKETGAKDYKVKKLTGDENLTAIV